MVLIWCCILLIQTSYNSMFVALKKHAQSAGFEPARGDPNGFLVHRLNHSATTAIEYMTFKLDLYIALYVSGVRGPKN